MLISVVWPRGRGSWDHALTQSLFDNRWRPSCAHEFQHFKFFAEVPHDTDGIVVVLPARHCTDYYSELNAQLTRFKWVLLLCLGDEERVFDYRRIQHSNMKVWQMLPTPGRETADRFLINGYAADTVEMLPHFRDEALSKPLDWFFAGQVTHKRREQCVAALQSLPNGDMLKTAGFTQGYSHVEYFQRMARAKIVPCPAGAEMPDSFRVAEALEAGAIPVVDGVSPKDSYPRNYWPYVFGEQPPFPILEDWSQFPIIMAQLLAEWPKSSQRIQSWWSRYKRQLSYNLRDDINALRKVEPVAQTIDDKITVLIPTSPIPSHPDTFKIDQCIAGIRYHLPMAEIIIMCDGARESVQHRAAQYAIYKEHLLWKAKHDPSWKNIHVEVFEQEGENHPHQSGMVRSVIERGLVKTPLVMFAEHDAPLVARPIDWQLIHDVISSGMAKLVRLYYFEKLIPEHAHMFHGSFRMPQNPSIEFVRTTQYSGWPHVITTENMLNLMRMHFPFRGRESMLETSLYSPVAEYPWDMFKVVIYAPEGNMQCFTHSNGRGEGAERDEVDW